ncbi:MAG TPA: histidine phosphatase family protein [Clostridia bacterium]|jgi:broad specificity phosphatase PhoE|nr:histidine phosphatase family protein [Clostridiaceae bacterium]HPZ52020.1 histidine phosphatase family protein [Clostridia bacterium]
MKLLIIRHGDPDYKNDTLTPKGWIEADLLSKRLEKINISKIYCSPLGRAKDTAKATLKIKNMDMEILDWLQEFPLPVKPDYEKEGLPVHHNGCHCPWDITPQYWDKYKDVFFSNDWMSHSVYKDSGIYEYYTKVGNELDKLLEKYGYIRKGQLYDVTEKARDDETIVFFCHMGLGLTLVSCLTRIPIPQIWHGFQLMPTSVTVVEMQRTPQLHDAAIARIVQMGDLSHLYNMD